MYCITHSDRLFSLLFACESPLIAYRYFERFGPVKDAFVMYHQETGQPRGFGFVTFEQDEGAEVALQTSFHNIRNKMVEVKRAFPKVRFTHRIFLCILIHVHIHTHWSESNGVKARYERCVRILWNLLLYRQLCKHRRRQQRLWLLLEPLLLKMLPPKSR